MTIVAATAAFCVGVATAWTVKRVVEDNAEGDRILHDLRRMQIGALSLQGRWYDHPQRLDALVSQIKTYYSRESLDEHAELVCQLSGTTESMRAAAYAREYLAAAIDLEGIDFAERARDLRARAELFNEKAQLLSKRE